MSKEKIIKTILHHCEDCALREYQTCNNCINDFKEAIKGLLDLYEANNRINDLLDIIEQKDKLIDGIYNLFYEFVNRHPGSGMKILKEDGFNIENCDDCDYETANCKDCIRKYFEERCK